MHDALVFTRTKHRANRLAKFLGDAGIKVERIHGNRSQSQRTEALAGFKSGKYRVLVATDIAARGIDVTALGHVVNFDVPHVRRRLHSPRRPDRARRDHRLGVHAGVAGGGRRSARHREGDRGAAAARDAAGLRLQRAPAAEPRSAAAASGARSAQPSARSRLARPAAAARGPVRSRRRSSAAGPARLAAVHDGAGVPRGPDRRAEGRGALRAARRGGAPPRPRGRA